MNTYLTYIIADDDPVYREITLQHLALIPAIQCLAVCDSAVSVRAELQKHDPDLLILDVEMPSLSGIELAKSLTVLPMIIFISSHSNYAADAFEVDAIDYLVKPVPPHRLMRAIEKARHLQELKNGTPASEGFKKENDNSFFIKDKSSFIRINYADVLYIESLGDFVNIFLQGGDKKIALVNLKNLEQQLPESSFIRISRTHMVNRHRITAIDSSTLALGKIQLPIGKTYSDNVMQHIIGNSAIKRFI
jgi:two-component system, LytTR family, response regulator